MDAQQQKDTRLPKALLPSRDLEHTKLSLRMNWYEKSTTDGKKENGEKASRLRFCENSEKVQKKVDTPELRSVRNIRCAKFTKPPEKLLKKKRKKRRDKTSKESADESRIYTYPTVSIVHTPEENTRMYCPQGR